MHEFGIAQGLLDAVLVKAQEGRASRIDWIKLEIGVMSGVEEDALQFAFTAISEGTIAEKAELRIERIPVRCHCPACDRIFECTPAAYHCPGCGGVSGDIRTGKEMNLVAMEIS